MTPPNTQPPTLPYPPQPLTPPILSPGRAARDSTPAQPVPPATRCSCQALAQHLALSTPITLAPCQRMPHWDPLPHPATHSNGHGPRPSAPEPHTHAQKGPKGNTRPMGTLRLTRLPTATDVPPSQRPQSPKHTPRKPPRVIGNTSRNPPPHPAARRRPLPHPAPPPPPRPLPPPPRAPAPSRPPQAPAPAAAACAPRCESLRPPAGPPPAAEGKGKRRGWGGGWVGGR